MTRKDALKESVNVIANILEEHTYGELKRVRDAVTCLSSKVEELECKINNRGCQCNDEGDRVEYECHACKKGACTAFTKTTPFLCVLDISEDSCWKKVY